MAKLIVVYRLKRGVTAATFESWVSDFGGPGGDLRRLEAFTTVENGAVEYVEVFHIPSAASFDASDMPPHIDACIMGEFAGLDGQPRIRVSVEPN